MKIYQSILFSAVFAVAIFSITYFYLPLISLYSSALTIENKTDAQGGFIIEPSAALKTEKVKYEGEGRKDSIILNHLEIHYVQYENGNTIRRRPRIKNGNNLSKFKRENGTLKQGSYFHTFKRDVYRNAHRLNKNDFLFNNIYFAQVHPSFVINLFHYAGPGFKKNTIRLKKYEHVIFYDDKGKLRKEYREIDGEYIVIPLRGGYHEGFYKALDKFKNWQYNLCN